MGPAVLYEKDVICADAVPTETRWHVFEMVQPLKQHQPGETRTWNKSRLVVGSIRNLPDNDRFRFLRHGKERVMEFNPPPGLVIGVILKDSVEVPKEGYAFEYTWRGIGAEPKQKVLSKACNSPTAILNYHGVFKPLQKSPTPRYDGVWYRERVELRTQTQSDGTCRALIVEYRDGRPVYRARINRYEPGDVAVYFAEGAAQVKNLVLRRLPGNE
jgi:hypothetical protein